MSATERAEFYKQRRSRSVALALALAAVVILFYVVSLIQGPGILQRPM
ncbi:MAG: CoxF protein [Devosiaceae bacterium]|nr:CoxF protein [Devosiaceae bacterium MH13]